MHSLPPPDASSPATTRMVDFAAMFPDAAHEATHPRHPGMHRTETVDYAILDEGETTMRAGDILIQRGTLHAWANRSTQIARIAFVLIDGAR